MVRREARPLADEETELRRELSDVAPAALDFLRKAGLEVSGIERGHGPQGVAPWLLLVRLDEHIAQAFDLAPEILLLLTPSQEALARDVEQAEEALVRAPQLDRSIVVVVTGDGSAHGRSTHVVGTTHRQYLFVTAGDVRRVVEPQSWLRRFLRDRLESADLFAPGRPVTGWDFVGRTAELDRLRRHLVAGRPVAIYGLRKIGKTSLALRELDRLAEETRAARAAGVDGAEVLSVHVDMQALAMESNIAGFMRRLVKGLFEAMERVGVSAVDLGLDPSSAGVASLRRCSDEEVRRLGADVLESSIDWARRGAHRHVIVFIDEYERFFEPQIFPAADCLTILDYLRGLVQTNSGSFNFIIAGLTRRYASQSMVGHRQNPLFNFVVDFPLAGLARNELQELFCRIGRRLGLEFDPGALDEIWEQTGGHPALAREYGRIMDRRVERAARVDGVRVGRSMVESCYPAYARHVELTMQDIARTVSGLDRAAPYVLRDLATEPFIGPSALSEETMEQLRRLGILKREVSGWRIAIKSFATWLVDNYPSSQAPGLVG